MPARLIIPPCQQNPADRNHPPRLDRALRIQVLGSNQTINKLFSDDTKMPSHIVSPIDFDDAGLELAKLAFRLLYGREVDPRNPSDFVPRHQYNTFHGKYGECPPWEHTCVDKYPYIRLVSANSIVLDSVDGYAITFDHLVSPTDQDPETLMMNICDPGDTEAAKYFKVDFAQYNVGTESVVLLVPRCCQSRRGTTDRQGINKQVKEAQKYLLQSSSVEMGA
jgi:hypothetical protein